MTIDIKEAFVNNAKSDGAYAIAYAILQLSDAQAATAAAIQRLGNGDASTHLGAIENLSMQVQGIATAIQQSSEH